MTLTVPVVPFADYWRGLFPFNSSLSADIHQRADACGYTSYLSTYLAFPPPSPLPPLADPLLAAADEKSASAPDCHVYRSVLDAVALLNPCFNLYHITTTCPLPADMLSSADSSMPMPSGSPSAYFNRADVKRAINAPPDASWEECTTRQVFVDNSDMSPPSSWTVLPRVIERSWRTVIGHGMLDMLLIANGTL